MRYLVLIIVLLANFNVCAQTDTNYKDVFIRVYNLKGKKIAKGKVLSVSKNSITLFRKNKQIEIKLDDIGKIRTKRSFGNNILKGAAIGGGALAIIGIAGSNDSSYLSFTPVQGAAIGTTIGGFFGSIIGAITGLFKKSEVYKIDGNEMKLELFRNLILENNE
jgi:hypothetical protein